MENSAGKMLCPVEATATWLRIVELHYGERGSGILAEGGGQSSRRVSH
jgi:hypothetical protein